MDVSDPKSQNYGKYLSSDEVVEIFAPENATISAVRNWLIQSGVKPSEIKHYQNKGWLSVDLPISKVEDLFRTEYYEVEHGGKVRLGTDEYHVPAHLAEHIDYINPGVKLSPVVTKRTATRTKAKNRSKSKPLSLDPEDWNIPLAALLLPENVQGCALNFTPSCYRALYDIPDVFAVLPGNEVGVFETYDTYAQADLDLFYAAYATNVPQGTHPILASVDGGLAPVAQDSELNSGESDLDLNIITSLTYPQNVTLYQVDDLVEEDYYGFLNTFLDALDGSYCNYTAYGITGDSPGVDPTYPDLLPGGYNKSEMCGVYTPTKVITISYGEAEADFPKAYLERQCNEFMKLGLQGTTVLIASGDYGVAGFPGDITDSGCLSGGNLTEKIFSPDAVSACPYMTSVGATQLQPNQTIDDPESALQTALAPAPDPESRFSSSGGFSNYYPIPSYQEDAIKSYFENHDPGLPWYVANDNASNIGENGGVYNRAGRGFPDIAANGAAFRTYMNGTLYHFFGTSLAAPLWSTVISLINNERALIGKSPVGFINPVLYSNPAALTDIKNGSNANCDSTGFSAVEGWDPVTGLGTPSFPRLTALWLALP
ncbi:peptidase S8/S53 domain-containing protein [Xylariales sp. PMI_506]|nr:peptidase S8/S53 domain-containing protein [Xylariales sp. PMI_506]